MTEGFKFTKEFMQDAEVIISRYPASRKQSAVMPLLTLAQRQNGGWLNQDAMDYVASLLDMAPIRVYEVASFYTMYNLSPVGTFLVEVCTTTPCWLRGSENIVKACSRNLGIKVGQTTADGKFTLKEAECLGACVNAPMLQVTRFDAAAGAGVAPDYLRYFEDLTPEKTEEILNSLAKGEIPKHGSAIRTSSEPIKQKA